MISIVELQKQYYAEFKGLPHKSSIVRSGHLNDAFELVVFDILYSKELTVSMKKENASTIAKYIIAPPDNAIDIFIEKESGDEYTYDIIQVKNKPLSSAELREAIIKMKRTIEDYCKNPKKVESETCRQTISDTNFDKNYKKNCTFYVVHTGTEDDYSGSEDNERIITITDLETLRNNETNKVKEEILITDNIENNVAYGDKDSGQYALICNINGAKLAELNNKYFSTEIGRNILFGMNLRESLVNKKSKTYSAMENTINTNPENFWYYNNGITIIAEDAEIIGSDNNSQINLKNFSIINGAQTTSSLGKYLKDAKKNNEFDKIVKLEKVFVLTRILKISTNEMQNDIAIFNNTQNAITSRDMVSNRPEQQQLEKWLKDETYPQIYVEIKRGRTAPETFRNYCKHRKTTNEILAQLAYASFLNEPFISKDKKSALFNNDFAQDDYVINKIYHDVFNYDADNLEKCGILFQKSKTEIDEVLFCQHLYKLGKIYLKTKFTERINNEQTKMDNSSIGAEQKKREERIHDFNLLLDGIGICMFYCISLYYDFKREFDMPKDKSTYNFDKFYSDKNYREELVKEFADLYLRHTVQIIKKTATVAGKAGNINNWIRSKQCQDAFMSELKDNLIYDSSLEERYRLFISKYKTQGSC